MTPLIAFDSDVLIYAASPEHHLGELVAKLFASPTGQAGVGSVLLLPEILTKPMRQGSTEELDVLAGLLSRLALLPCTEPTANLALVLGVKYGLRAADSVHLATAVEAGADAFLTNNMKDFPRTISEVEVI
ncbi:MAG: type II toxin-antitoxin system VapC family toxin [Propionibacteriaceae bacterium]|nr:type II toxin-antitoxin system VapC family toxin [Propionibacteriaceae bacterium]